jgi:hypothetical protein
MKIPNTQWCHPADLHQLSIHNLFLKIWQTTEQVLKELLKV